MTYRDINNPYALEHMLYDAQMDYKNALKHSPENTQLLLDLHEEIEDLKAKVTQAWLEDEAANDPDNWYD